MVQRSQGPDPEEELERFEKENHELLTQVKFLEDEVALLRRRLSNAPRQVKVLEEQILQTRSGLMRAANQNEKLVSALKTEREKIESAERIAFHTGQNVEQIEEDSERDRWFTAEGAMEYGIIDHVIVKRGEIK